MQGAVLVTLHKGEDLPSADPNGYSDPYVKFKLHDKSHKSTIKRFTLNPAWNEKFEWFRVRLLASAASRMPWPLCSLLHTSCQQKQMVAHLRCCKQDCYVLDSH